VTAVGQRGGQDGSQEGESSAQPLGAAVDSVGDYGAHADIALVEEVANGLASVRAAIVDLAHVDLPHLPHGQPLGGSFQIAGDAQGADEVRSGAAADDPQGEIGAQGAVVGDQAVGDLVDGAVAADQGDAAVSLGSLAGDGGGVALTLGEGDIERGEQGAQLVLDGWPAAAGGAVGGVGVDDEDKVRHQGSSLGAARSSSAAKAVIPATASR